MPSLKLVAALAAATMTVSLLVGVRAGFETAPVPSGVGPVIRTLSPAARETARPAATTDSAGSGSEITMPYYSYGASLPTLLKD